MRTPILKFKNDLKTGDIGGPCDFPPDHGDDKILLSKTQVLQLIDTVFDGEDLKIDYPFSDLIARCEIKEAVRSKHFSHCNDPKGDPKDCRWCREISAN
jgi:hypothetical protein